MKKVGGDKTIDTNKFSGSEPAQSFSDAVSIAVKNTLPYAHLRVPQIGVNDLSVNNSNNNSPKIKSPPLHAHNKMSLGS